MSPVFENEGRQLSIDRLDNGDVKIEGDPVAVANFLEHLEYGMHLGYDPLIVNEKKVILRFIGRLPEA